MACQTLDLTGACNNFIVAYNYDLQFSLALFDVGTDGNKTPRDLTGVTITLRIKDQKGITTIDTYTSTNVDNIATFTILNTNILANYSEGQTYVYDITTDNGIESPLYNGKITFVYV
jgi:hypothetical protein